MKVSLVKANKLCQPGGIGKDDSSSRRIGDEVADQMDGHGQNGMTQIETQPGDTLQSVAKGHLMGSGQKVDVGSLLSEQRKILHENEDQIKGGMKGSSKDPNDFMTHRGRELPAGIKIDLSTTHTQYSMTPASPENRDQLEPGSTTEETDDTNIADQPTDQTQDNKLDGKNNYAGAGSMSDTQYMMDMLSVGLSDDVKQGIHNFLSKKKKSS